MLLLITVKIMKVLIDFVIFSCLKENHGRIGYYITVCRALDIISGKDHNNFVSDNT